MKKAKLIAWLGVLAMSLALLNGFINGSFFSDGGTLMKNPWGIVSIVDLYVGFILFAMWIAFREQKPTMSLFWIVQLMILGFFTASLYILIKLYQSREDWLTFFLGSKKDVLLKAYNEKHI